MSIVEDSSTPATVSVSANNATSASFSPPAGSLLVAIASFARTSSGTMTMAMSDTGSHTWSTGVLFNNASFPEIVGVFYTYLTTAPGSITTTVTTTGSGTAEGILATRVLLGAAVTQNGASNSAHATNTASISVTTTQQGSVVYGGVSDGGSNAALTVNGVTTQLAQQDDATTGTSTAVFKATSATTTPGATTYGYNTLSTGDGVVTAAFEILPAIYPRAPRAVLQAVTRAGYW